MTKIQYHSGDIFKELWKYKGEDSLALITHVCNDIKGWGSGFVKSMSKHYPMKIDDPKNVEYSPEHAFRQWCKTPDYKLGAVQFCTAGWRKGMHIQDVEHYCEVANMVAQHQTIKYNKKPIRYAALVKCMITVRKEIQNMELPVEIHAPKFGSDLAGGTWDFIEELIEELWLNNDIPVHIYVLK